MPCSVLLYEIRLRPSHVRFVKDSIPKQVFVLKAKTEAEIGILRNGVERRTRLAVILSYLIVPGYVSPSVALVKVDVAPQS